MRAFPDPVRLLEATPQEREVVLGRRFAGRLADLQAERWPEFLARAELVIAAQATEGITSIAVDDDRYPPLMRLAPHPAAILYARGSLEVVATSDCVAVVGTREPTSRGRVVTARLARALADEDFVIVSGLAKGIDEEAHRATVEAGRPTVAVLGTAIDKVYPASNKGLAQAILDSGGALVSEYPTGFATTGRHFVERDRLQAAMSIAVIAVQTGVTGGTLHTIRFAHEARRAVLVPRPLATETDHPMYGGIHELLSSGHAAAIESNDDYPALGAYLRTYRDWLLAPAGASAPAAFTPPGSELVTDTQEPEAADQESFGL